MYDYHRRRNNPYIPFPPFLFLVAFCFAKITLCCSVLCYFKFSLMFTLSTCFLSISCFAIAIVRVEFNKLFMRLAAPPLILECIVKNEFLS